MMRCPDCTATVPPTPTWLVRGDARANFWAKFVAEHVLCCFLDRVERVYEF